MSLQAWMLNRIPCLRRYDAEGRLLVVRCIECPDCGARHVCRGARRIDPILNEPDWLINYARGLQAAVAGNQDRLGAQVDEVQDGF